MMGPLVRQLRENRRLTQQDLANLAGLAVRTIYQVEQSQKPPRRSTCIAILSALNQQKPLSAAENAMFLRDSGMETAALRTTAAAERHATTPSVATSPDERIIHAYVADLIEQTSPSIVIKLLEAAASLAGVPLRSPDLSGSPPTFTVSHPPRRRPDGSLEQVFVDYTAPAAKPKPTSRRKRA